MKQYLNITTLDGKKVPPVDVITFGSPCQDLSVAGRREGLEGERSHLFYEAVRIIQEMRENTHGKYPRFAVWENVTGAFSSAKGKDFAAVLTALIQLAEPQAPHLPVPAEGWSTAGALRSDMGGRWSLAWRTFNAQYWGVPQRRKRILLVADFGGNSAREVLFEPKSLCWDTQTVPTEGERTSAHASEGIGRADVFASNGFGGYGTGCGTLRANGGDLGGGSENLICFHLTQDPITDEAVSPCLTSGSPQGQATVGVLFENHREDCRYKEQTVCPTMTAKYGTGGDNIPYVLSVETHMDGSVRAGDVVPTLANRDYKGNKNVLTEGLRVRRLTPTECARLQGFPDCWASLPHIVEMNEEDYQFWQEVLKSRAQLEGKTYKQKTKPQMIAWYNKLHTDSAEYKMWGNGVALPMVRAVMSGLAQQGAETMGSLFDGSGGFPLASYLEGMTPLWSSEVEPYPIAVTRERFKFFGRGEEV